MDGLRVDEHAHETGHNAMQDHLRNKLGKPTDHGLKTPMRPGLGLVVNESKTPGAKSLQGLASARKAASAMKSVEPKKIDYEIYQDEEEEKIESAQQPSRPYSPIDTCNRYYSNDSLADDIADDMLNLGDQLTELHEEPILDVEPESIDLGAEDWDSYGPIEIASRIAVDDYHIPLSLDEFRHENDVVLEEGEYHYPEFGPVERTYRQWEELDMDDLLAELDAIVEGHV